MPSQPAEGVQALAEERGRYKGEERSQLGAERDLNLLSILAPGESLSEEAAMALATTVNRILEGMRNRISRWMNAQEVDDAGVITGPAARYITRGQWEAARCAGTLIVFYESGHDRVGKVFDRATHPDQANEPIHGEVHHARLVRLPANLTMSRSIPPHDHADYETRMREDRLGFGDEKEGIINTDAMVMMVHDGGKWMEQGQVLPLMELSAHPNAQVLHYGSALFEGIGCERNEEGEICIFDLEGHYERLSEGARHFKFPPLPRFEVFKKMILDLIEANERFIPEVGKGRLYLRPNLVDIGPKLKVNHSKTTALIFTATSIGNAGSYFGSITKPIIAAVSTDRMRAVPGQEGHLKAGGNYARTIEAVEAAEALGLKGGVAYLDRLTPRGCRPWALQAEFKETHASNLIAFEKLEDGRWKIVTPPLNEGDILPGRTRALILQLAKELGWEVEEKPLKWQDVALWNKYHCLASSGTGAYLTPIHGVQLMEIGEREALGLAKKQVMQGMDDAAREAYQREHVGKTIGSVAYCLGRKPNQEELIPEPIAILIREMERVKRGQRKDSPQLDRLVTRHRIGVVTA